MECSRQWKGAVVKRFLNSTGKQSERASEMTRLALRQNMWAAEHSISLLDIANNLPFIYVLTKDTAIKRHDLK